MLLYDLPFLYSHDPINTGIPFKRLSSDMGSTWFSFGILDINNATEVVTVQVSYDLTMYMYP